VLRIGATHSSDLCEHMDSTCIGNRNLMGNSAASEPTDVSCVDACILQRQGPQITSRICTVPSCMYLVCQAASLELTITMLRACFDPCHSVQISGLVAVHGSSEGPPSATVWGAPSCPGYDSAHRRPIFHPPDQCGVSAGTLPHPLPPGVPTPYW